MLFEIHIVKEAKFNFLIPIIVVVSPFAYPVS